MSFLFHDSTEYSRKRREDITTLKAEQLSRQLEEKEKRLKTFEKEFELQKWLLIDLTIAKKQYEFDLKRLNKIYEGRVEGPEFTTYWESRFTVWEAKRFPVFKLLMVITKEKEKEIKILENALGFKYEMLKESKEIKFKPLDYGSKKIRNQRGVIKDLVLHGLIGEIKRIEVYKELGLKSEIASKHADEWIKIVEESNYFRDNWDPLKKREDEIEFRIFLAGIKERWRMRISQGLLQRYLQLDKIREVNPGYWGDDSEWI
jgi:hypothetical protein